MSFHSSPHPLSFKEKDVKYPITHQTHINPNELQKYKSEYKIINNESSKLLGGTFLNDRNLCSVESDKFGNIGGCSYEHNKNLSFPQPDIIDKVSNDGFASRLFNFNSENLEENKESKNNILTKKNLKKNLKIKKSKNLNKIDGLPDNLNENDLYETYCHRKYAQYFPLKNML